MGSEPIAPAGHTLADLHRAVIVAELTYNEANAAAVAARSKAMSMLEPDLRASREADVAAHKAYLAAQRADKVYRDHIRESYS